MTWKRLLWMTAVVAVFAATAFSATSQVQFIAKLQEVTPLEGGMTALTVELTPSISVPVLVDEDTEIRDENDLPAAVLDLAPGMVLKIRGVFVAAGILAREIEIQENDSEFEVRGVIETVAPDGSGGGTIRLAGFEMEVPADAEIRNRGGEKLTFADLAPGQLAKVEGRVVDGRLVALRITIQTPNDRFALIRLEGVIGAIQSDFEFTVELEGGVPVQVLIDEETEIRGVLAVGARVRVEGVLNENLAVLARRIAVIDSVRLAPRQLEMGFEETRQVSVILLAPRDTDTVFALSSSDPDIAFPTADTLTVPAGELTAAFEVASRSVEGETFIQVATEGFQGRVKVEVEEEDEVDDEPPMTALRLLWEPRVIHAAPRGAREVRLRINHRAPEDLPLMIGQESGTEDFVAYPEMLIIPAGAKEVRFEISFLKDQGDAVLRATLPDSVGGGSADLEISLRPVKAAKVEIEWDQDEVSLRVGETREAQLRLDQPAPFDLDAALSLKSGNRSMIGGLPGHVRFAAGESRAVVTLTAARPGKLKLRAVLPLQVGGDDADLEIEVKR